MEPAGLKVLTERCGNIRWKGMFIDAEWDPTVQQSNDRIYWCVFTQRAIGPDGQVVDEDTCTTSRSCYEPT
jgi:hypothetical protein